MLRLILALIVTACLIPESQAGPIARRLAARSGGCSSGGSASQSASSCGSSSTQAAVGCSSSSAAVSASGCSSAGTTMAVYRGTFGPGGETTLPPVYQVGDTLVLTPDGWKLVPAKK